MQQISNSQQIAEKVRELTLLSFSLTTILWSRQCGSGKRIDIDPWNQFSSVQSFNRVWHFLIPRTAARQGPLSITNSRSLLKLMSIESVMPSNHPILCCSLLLLPSIFTSMSLYQRVSSLQQVAKVLELRLQHQTFQWIFRLNSFRVDWFDILAIQGTLKSLLQHDSSKESMLQCSAFFIIQLSPPYMTTGKTIAFPRWAFVGKVMPLLYNMLYNMTFLPRSKCLLISRLQWFWRPRK